MNIDELRSVQNREREAASLQNLRPTFYQDAGAFIADLEAERDRAAERADDPFASPEVRRLTDDIETAKSTVEAIYERRVGKVVKMASIAAAEMPSEEENLTNEERELFEELVKRITENREHVLDEVLEGDGPGISCSRDVTAEAAADASDTVEPERPSAGPDGSPSRSGRLEPKPGDPDPSGAPAEADANTASSAAAGSFMSGEGSDPDADDGQPAGRSVGAEPAPAGETSGPTEATPSGTTPSDRDVGAEPDNRTEPATPEGPAAVSSDARGEGAGPAEPVDRSLVRITDDVGEIFGVDDRAYELSTDEVVTLPEANAGPLVERGAAERLE